MVYVRATIVRDSGDFLSKWFSRAGPLGLAGGLLLCLLVGPAPTGAACCLGVDCWACGLQGRPECSRQDSDTFCLLPCTPQAAP